MRRNRQQLDVKKRKAGGCAGAGGKGCFQPPSPSQLTLRRASCSAGPRICDDDDDVPGLETAQGAPAAAAGDANADDLWAEMNKPDVAPAAAPEPDALESVAPAVAPVKSLRSSKVRLAPRAQTSPPGAD